jgi:U3 small nucleolar RNA-associated protein 22
MVKSDGPLSVDMVVIMPPTIFQEKDYMNYRYFYKRAYYLACIAAGLQSIKQDKFAFRYEYMHGNSLLPILCLKEKPRKDNRSSHGDDTKNEVENDTKPEVGYEIRIIPAAHSTCFPESKLSLEKNCVRPRDKLENEITTMSPTPFYNSSIRSNCNHEAYLRLFHSSTKLSSGFRDACILGRIWLRQRGFGSSLANGGFGHFEWTALTALLLKGGGPKGHSVLSVGYSSYQMFKAVLQFLSAHNLATKPFVYASESITVSKMNAPIVYDGERGQNLLYKMTPWSYNLLQQEANTSLSMLNDALFDSFESTFIVRSSQSLQKFDCSFRISQGSQPVDASDCDHMSKPRRFSRRLFQVLQEGLMDRIKLVNLEEAELPSWPTKSAGPALSESPLLVSVIFDPMNIDRLVDHGPAAEEKKKAAKFQKFWGQKAELRRFKDGSILESLVWSPGSSYAIFREVVSYLVKRHFDIETGVDILVGEGFDKMLPGPGATTKGFDALKESFRVLERQIQGMESLPLQLRQFSSLSPQLRYSSLEVPSFSPRQALNSPADVLIQFEGSGRWPDDIVAIQRTKIAFLLKIGSILQEIDETITARVGLENEAHPLQNCAFLDIIYDSGAAFRLRIHNDREQTLLERQVKDKSIDQHSREDAVSALSIFKKTFIQLPLLTQSITTHCTRFPLLSPTIRLVKMWFERHMLLRHISEELVELLVSRTFLQPYPWTAPSSVMTGFLRTLHFISRWDWRTEPLIVDFTGMMTIKDVDAINTRLEAWRKIDPGMVRTVLVAASNHDTTGTAFTDNGPSKMVAARMTALARSACKLVKDKGLDLDHRSLFAPSTSDYDFVIHLSPKFTESSKRKGSSSSKFKNLEVQSETNIDIIDYQPVQAYITELEKVYTHSVVLFHGSAGGPVIAGLWHPQITAPRPFKINLAYGTRVNLAKGSGEGSEDTIELDKSAILSEIARLGGDIVSFIEVNR